MRILNMPTTEKLLDQQLEIIKRLFRIHNTTVKSIADAVRYNAERDIKHVPSEHLLEICKKSIRDIKEISDNL
jgi:hypothetical protein